MGETGAADQRTSLLITDLDLRATVTYYPKGDPGTPVALDSDDETPHHFQVGEVFGWAPGGQHFAFSAQSDQELPYQALVGRLGADAIPAFPEAEGAVIHLRWVDANRFLFVAQAPRGWSVLLGSADGGVVPVAGIGGTGLPPTYDFAAPETDAVVSEGLPAADLPEGLVYGSSEGLWRVDDAGQPQLVFERGDGAISPDGLQVLYDEPDDIWLADLATGERRNVTASQDRIECCAQWWPNQTETILFSSWTSEDAGPSYGFPTVAQLDGSGYAVLDDSGVSYSLPAPSPDGQTVAYDRAGMAWLYGRKTGLEPFDPSAYGLPVTYGSPGEQQWRIVSPAWSPDGQQLAWVVADCREGSCETSIGVFDLTRESLRMLHPYVPVGRGGQPAGPLWSPDGQWLAFVVWAEVPEQAGLWVMRADEQEEYAVEPGLVRANLTPVWSPDSRWLAFSSVSSDGDTRLFWLVEVGTWHRVSIELPPDAYLVTWLRS
jgi:hypothetical protein